MTMMKGLLAAAVSLACLTAAGSAHAAVTISFDQIGADVVATTTGTFDRTLAVGRGASQINGGQVFASRGLFVSGQGGAGSLFDLSGVTSIGTGLTAVRASETTGTGFFVARNLFNIADAYTNNSQIMSTSVFANTTIAALGLTPAIYRYAAGGNAITLNVNAAVAAVPESATWAMMLVGFGMIGATARYRRRRIATVYT